MSEEKESITLYLPRWVINKAKAIAGEDYKEFLARVLENALKDPKVIEKYQS